MTDWDHANLFSGDARLSDRPDETRQSLEERKHAVLTVSYFSGLYWSWISHNRLRGSGTPTKQTHTETQRASNRNQQKGGEKPLPSRQAFRPRQLSQSRPTAKQTISISQTYSSLSFLVQISWNVLGGPFPCGNGELTSNLHIFRWYIIIKDGQGGNVQLRVTVFRRWMCDC